MKLVKCKDRDGCAPACIATILGWTYEEVTKFFQNDFTKDGITHEQSVVFLAREDF